MGDLVASPEAIAAASGHVTNVRDQLDGEIRNVRDACESSRAFWEGEAAAAFTSLMERYDNASRKQHEALSEIAEKIKDSGRGYSDADQQNLTSIHQAGNSGSLSGLF
ncbi:WXG100 family type VII secretion target [Rhodococcus sp. HNM0569]|uniref:WXG100 family type VII secretion target n=1 Tax=Rhodococcus sp. HNM0569 TaxID=2716340 RepID=UPI00146D8F6C|nr:WXG100 family type VII secretion target [Rhodococcus sp. HNM0569]NLU81764.1 WXG100 family type VII secretion target [Rhodococcus sp. HNM0569]